MPYPCCCGGPPTPPTPCDPGGPALSDLTAHIHVTWGDLGGCVTRSRPPLTACTDFNFSGSAAYVGSSLGWGIYQVDVDPDRHVACGNGVNFPLVSRLGYYEAGLHCNGDGTFSMRLYWAGTDANINLNDTHLIWATTLTGGPVNGTTYAFGSTETTVNCGVTSAQLAFTW